MKRVMLGLLPIGTVMLSSLLILLSIQSSEASPTIIVYDPFSFARKFPEGNPTEFRILTPINATGFWPGENVTIKYQYPLGTCIQTRTADSQGKLSVSQGLACREGSAGFLAYGAHEGTNYIVTATGMYSRSTANTTFVPTLTNGSVWNLGPPCTNACAKPFVSNSTLHLAYFNPNENDSYNKYIKLHTAKINSNQANGFDYALSFNKTNLYLYPPNITLVKLAYNVTTNGTTKVATTNGINQAISEGWSWIGYDNECNNGRQSTPKIEMVYKTSWGSSGPESKCTQGVSSLNASAIGNYTNLASSLVKKSGKNFMWAPQIFAMNASYSPGRHVYEYVNWTAIDAVILQLQDKKYSSPNNVTQFNASIAKISDFVRTKNANTLIFISVNPGTNPTKCNCTMESVVYDLQYSRFHASTPTKWLYNGVSIVLTSNATAPPPSPSIIDTFDTYLGR